MNCRVRADFPTPPLPTMITLWRAREVWFLFLPEAMILACREGQEETSRDRKRPAETGRDQQRQEETSRDMRRPAETGRDQQGQTQNDR